MANKKQSPTEKVISLLDKVDVSDLDQVMGEIKTYALQRLSAAKDQKEKEVAAFAQKMQNIENGKENK